MPHLQRIESHPCRDEIKAVFTKVIVLISWCHIGNWIVIICICFPLINTNFRFWWKGSEWFYYISIAYLCRVVSWNLRSTVHNFRKNEPILIHFLLEWWPKLCFHRSSHHFCGLFELDSAQISDIFDVFDMNFSHLSRKSPYNAFSWGRELGESRKCALLWRSAL